MAHGKTEQFNHVMTNTENLQAVTTEQKTHSVSRDREGYRLITRSGTYSEVQFFRTAQLLADHIERKLPSTPISWNLPPSPK